MLPMWLWLSALVLLSWGTLGLFQKVAMNHICASAALIWAAAGFMLLQPLLFPGGSVFEYSTKSLGWALLNGVFNGLGFLSLMAAMRQGGKASIVEPLSALYPVFVVLLAPALLHESIEPRHGLGIACAVIGGMLLSAETVTVRKGSANGGNLSLPKPLVHDFVKHLPKV
jgi:transporter family protein